MLKKFINFLKDVRLELEKVVWPKRNEVFRITLIVIATVIIAMAIVAVFDLVLLKIVQIFVTK